MGRILVVDDDPTTVEAMATLLAQDGHEVEAFTSGKEAIAALRSGRAFEVVVTDLEMPVVDGATVTRAARELSPNACIVVTDQGTTAPNDLVQAGACFVLEKPIEYEAVHRAIAACRAIGGHAGPRGAKPCQAVSQNLTEDHRLRPLLPRHGS
jgi:two-component system chemotaxis response regulator CheY